MSVNTNVIATGVSNVSLATDASGNAIPFVPAQSCEYYGASPSASASVNTTAIQTALNKQGKVTLTVPGTFVVNPTLTVYSFTSFELGKNTVLKLADNNEGNILRNSCWNSAKTVCTNGVNDAATSPVLAGFRLATADCGANAHGLTVGQCVLIRGDTTRRYNGIFQIVAATTYTLSFYVSAVGAIGASSGSITIEEANTDIEVTGGMIDYNGINNQSAYTYNAFLSIFNKVRNLHIHDIDFIDVTKYCAYIVNSVNSKVRNIDLHTAADGIHLHGLTYNACVENISGESGDDFVVWSANSNGYTQYDWLNIDGSDTLSAGGEAYGLTFRNIKPLRCGQDVLVMYPCAGSSYGLEGVLAENIGTDESQANYIFCICTGVATAADCNAVKDIVVRNVRGIGKSSMISLGRSTNTGKITYDKVDISGIYPNGNYSLANGMIDLEGAIINKLIVEPRSKIVFDITSAVYGIYMSGTSANVGASTVTDLTVVNYECDTTGAGNSHTVLLAGTGSTLTKARFVRPKLFGTSQLLGGIFGGTPQIDISDWYVNSYRLAWVNSACRLHITNGQAVNCTNPPIAIFGSGFTAEIMTRGNDWGATAQWLQVGSAAGDTCRLDLWASGNYANAGISSGINWVSTSGTFYLRGGDHTLNTDISKWTATTAGVSAYNSVAAVTPGTGLVSYDGAAWRRVAAKIQAVTSSASPALDCNLGNHVTFTATSASTWGAPTHIPPAGDSVSFTITQDGTGGWAISWNAAYKFATAWTNTGNTANKMSTIKFVSDGTALVAQGANSWY